MAGRYSIETVFRLIDNITAPLDKIGAKSSKVGKVLKRDFMAAQDSLDNLGKKLKKIGGYALAAGIGAIGIGLGIATKQFIEYDQAITAATAKFKDLDTTSETYKDSLKQIGQLARDVAASTEYDAVDTAGALDKMAMAGLSSEQAMAMLMGTTNLATAAGMDLTTAVDIATDSLGAFGLIADDALQLQTNFDRVSDVMAKTTNMFNTDMPGMFEAVKKGGPAFTSAGQSIETFSSLIGVMASSGVKGSEAGTQLRNVMLSLANPAEKAAKQMERLGIVTQDSQGNYLDIIDILSQFEAATKSMGSAEKAAALSTIFGSRAVTGINILLQEGTESLRDYRTQLENAGGAAANIANAMRGSIQNKIENLTGALTELGFKFVEAFQEKGIGLIEKLTDAVSNFDPQPIIDAAVTIGNVIANVIGLVWKLRFFILGAAAAWGIYKAAMIGAVVVSKIMGLVKAVQTLMMVQKGMNVVQALFNVLLMANPVGLVIAAIAILVGLFALAYQKCEPFRNTVNGVLEKLKALGAHIIEVLSPAFEVIKGVVQKVITVFGTIFSTIVQVISLFFDLFNITNQTAGSFSLFDVVLQGFSTGLQVVGTLLGGLVDTVGALFEGIGNIISAFQNGGFIAGIKQIGISLLNFLLTPIKAILEAVSFLPGIGGLAKKGAEKIAQFQEFLSTETEKNIGPTKTAAATVEAVSPPAAVTNPAPAVSPAAAVSPAITAPGSPISNTQTLGIRHPALLNLREGRLFSAGPGIGPATVPRAASLWNVPANTQTASATQSPAAASPVPAPLAQAAPRVVETVSVPVKYDFPEMGIPPEMIRPVLIPVSWVYPPPPEAPFTSTASISPARNITRTTSSISGGRQGRYVPAASPAPSPFAQTAPPAVTDRIVPPAAEYPVAPSVGAALAASVSPMTRAEQMAAEQVLYSRTENQETVNVKISTEKGLEARIVNPPKSPNVKLEVSGTV
jgi:TP901 family phage tail tape measure protein